MQHTSTATATPTATAYVNGRIYTVDPKRPWAEACLVVEGRFEAVGSTKEIQAAAGSAQVVDLGGRMVMPGIHDAHTHLLLSGLKHRVEARLAPAAQSEESVTRTLKNFCQCCDRGVLGLGRWIVGGDINPNLFPKDSTGSSWTRRFPMSRCTCSTTRNTMRW